MPIMPNVVGQELGTALASLQTAGVLNPSAVGYFGTWPISALWQRSNSPPSTILTQSVNSGNSIAVNSPILLGISQFPVAVIYP